MNIICVFIFLIISLLLIVNFKCTFMVVSACSMVLGCMNGVGPFGMYQAVSIAAFSIFMLNIIDCILCVEQSLRRIPSLRFIGFLHSGRCGFTVCILSNYK